MPARLRVARGVRVHGGRERQYLARLSRPLLDRIDLHLEVPAVAYAELSAGGGESSTAVRARVEAARRQAAHGALRQVQEAGPFPSSTTTPERFRRPEA